MNEYCDKFVRLKSVTAKEVHKWTCNMGSKIVNTHKRGERIMIPQDSKEIRDAQTQL